MKNPLYKAGILIAIVANQIMCATLIVAILFFVDWMISPPEERGWRYIINPAAIVAGLIAYQTYLYFFKL